jgi:FlgD Ig-like domain
MKKAIPLLLIGLFTLVLAGTELSNTPTNSVMAPIQNIWGKAPKSSPSVAPSTDDSLWEKVDSVPLASIGASDAYLGIKAYGDTLYVMWNRNGLPWQLLKIDRITGSVLGTVTGYTTQYALSAVRVDDSIYVSTFYPTDGIDVYDKNGSFVRTMTPPGGYMCRGMDWDGSKFWVADNTPYPSAARIYTMSRSGALLRTLTGSGTVTWIMDMTIDKMMGNRVWLNDNPLNQTIYVNVDTIANSYSVLAQFPFPGSVTDFAEGVGFYGPDGSGSGYVYTEGAASTWAWKMKVHQGGGGLDHDVALNQILAPGSFIPSSPLTPRAEIKNWGTNPESNIPVYCWIDSGATRLYTQSFTYTGPLDPNATAEVSFSPTWTPGGDGATYHVTMFTDLEGDQNEGNDTARRTTIVQNAPNFGTQMGSWTLSAFGRQYAMAGITYRPDNNKYYIAAMSPNEVWSFSPNDPVGTLTNENWSIHTFYGNDIIWGIAWDPVTEGFWTTQIEGNQTACKAARYVDGAWAATPADSWELYSIEPANWFGGLDYNYDQGYFWNTKVGGTNYFYKLDLHNKTNLGHAAGPATSYRANSYFGHGYNWLISGGWNQNQIIKLDTLGTVITSASLTSLADCDIYEPTSPAPESVIVAYCTASDANNTLYRVSMGLTWGAVGIKSEPNKTTEISNLTVNTVPNPVTNRAMISFSVPVRSNVKIDVFDATGRTIRNLVNSTFESGNHSVTWDGKDANAHRVANGIYFYTLETPDHSITKKLILMK